MFHIGQRLAVAIILGALVSGTATATDARPLTVVSWGGPYQDTQRQYFFKPFQDETGTQLQEATWDGGVGLIRAKVQSGHSDWDVMQVGPEDLAIGCEEGLFEKLDYSRIGGKNAYLPETVDPCGVGATILSYVLGYDGSKLKNGPKGWADLFDVKKFPGKRTLHAEVEPTFEMALMADGVPPQDVYKVLATEAGVDRVFKKLDAIKSKVIWWQTGMQPTTLLTSGEVTMAVFYNGRISDAIHKGKPFVEVWNHNVYDIDHWVILKGSTNLDAAYKFLDFIRDPKRQAQVADATYNGMSNKQTNSFVDPKILPELPTAPQNLAQALKINSTFWMENYDKLNDRFTKWAAQ